MERLTARPMARGEAPEVARLAQRHLQRWSASPAGWLDAAFVDAAFDRPGAEPDQDFTVYELDGHRVGGCAVFHQPPYSEIDAYPYYDPDLAPEDVAAVGRAIVERASSVAQRYADRAAAGAQPMLSLGVQPTDPLRDVVAALGFDHVRSGFIMRRDLAPDETAPGAPAGIRTRSVDPDADAAAVAEVGTAFADHHGDQVFSEEQLRWFMSRPTARADLSRLAEDADGACAFVLCSVEPDGGHVDILATLQRARGRGVGSALLREAFAALATAGCTVVRLNVDAENTTGALRLYERAGMTRESETQQWMRPLRAPSR